MIAPPMPSDEAQRIESLRNLRVLYTEAEARFDRITRAAAAYFKAPIALVSLVDTNRQWFKSCVGVNVTETPRSISFCGHAILQDEVFVIPDAAADPRFADNPLVTGETNVRFYAGVPLRGPGGYKVGTLCIMDHVARDFSEQERSVLKDFAAWAELELNSHELSNLIEERNRLLKLNKALGEAVKLNEEEIGRLRQELAGAK